MICDLFELVFDRVPEPEWNQTQRKTVIFSGFVRWALNGGFKSYLLMPVSVNCEETIQFLHEAGQGTIGDALEVAAKVFDDIEFDDVDARQAYRLTESDLEKIENVEDEFFDHVDELYESAVAYFWRNSADFV